MQKMTEGAPWKHIIGFAFPVFIGSLLQQLYNTVDTIIVGKYTGQTALSAVGTTGSFAFFFLAIATGLSAGSGVVIARHFGAGDTEKVRRAASSGIIFLMGLGLIAALLGAGAAFPAFRYLIAVPDDFLDMTVSYFRFYAVGLVFQFGYNIFSSILRAVGDSTATMLFLLISSVLNIGLDMLFVAVFDWGVVGAAIATDIAQLASFIAAYLYMSRRYPVFKFRISEYVFDFREIKNTVKIGMPISLQLVIVSVGFSFIQRAVNGFGENMIASFTVGQRIEQYINLPCNALQTTLATYTGQNVGAAKTDRIKAGVRQGILISLIVTLLISLIIWFFTDSIVGFFSLEAGATEYCIPHIRTIAFINVILASYIPLFGVYQGTGHSGIPTIVATCALTVRVITVYLFRYSGFLGYSIIWWNGLFGFGFGFMITWGYYISGRWKKYGKI